MPLINPFNPEIELKVVKQEFTQINHDRVTDYLNISNWKCPNCGSIVFGRTLVCPFNSKGEYCKTRRPE